MSFLVPRNSTERRFLTGFGVVGLVSIVLLIGMGREGWSALTEQWVPVMLGNTEISAKAVDFAKGGTVFAALYSLVLLTVLWLGRSIWCKEYSQEKGSRSLGRLFWVGLATVLAIALVVRAPRMTLSLYNDEIETLQRYVVGSYPDVIRKADELLLSDEVSTFRSVSWVETAFENRRGNNHALYSILARLVHGGEGINEVAFRIPALVGGLLSIGAVGLIFAAMGRPRVGLIAMFVLALHPWHVRFSTEARGYGIQMAMAALAVWCLIRAVNEGGWRWWIGFAVAQACCLWANAGALYFAIGLNLAVLVIVLSRREWGAWLVSNLLSAMAFFFAMAPLLPQLKAATESNNTLKQGLPFGWWPDVGSYLAIGMPWFDGDPESVTNPAISKWWGEDIFLTIGFPAVVVIVAVGIVSLLRGGQESRWLLVVAPILGIGTASLMSALTGATLLEWYLVWAAIFVAGWFAVGVAAIFFDDNSRAPGWRRYAVYVCLLLFLAAAWKPLGIYRNYSKQGLRDAVELINTDGGDPLVAFWWTEAALYDPNMRVVFLPEQLSRIEQKAEAEGRELFFILGNRANALAEQPAIVERLEGDAYELAGAFPGLEEVQFHTSVFRLKR